jgi:anti-sigma-K factor RskA
MRYENPELIDALAREYVLGTLQGGARKRFAEILSGSLAARRSVAAWEQRFAPLAAGVKPVEPPVAAWAEIESALGLRRAPRATAGFWPALAAGLALVAIVFGGLYLTRAPTVAEPAYVAVFSEADLGPIWLLQGFVDTRELRVTTVMPRPAPAGSSYQLWMLPTAGDPVSLGLLPDAGNALLPLSDAALGVLTQTMTLAVSVEPAGGSPTNLPTGPVILTTPLIRA